MPPIIEAIPYLTVYQPSLISLTLLCLITLIQNVLTAPFAFLKEEQVPGIPLKGDHSFFSFRVMRTHANSVESVPTFGLTLLIAIIFGVAAALVNWLSIIYLGSRLAFWAVYYSGIGKAAGGPRTLCYVTGLICNLILVGSCLYTLY